MLAFQGHDFPIELPIPAEKKSLMAVEESAVYPLLGDPTDLHWLSLTSAGYGFTRFEPNDRVFIVTMFHEVRK
jgi:hypothetical protein